METETNYDDQYNVPEPIQPQFEDYFEIVGDTAGGMGEVYFCKDKRSGELYALKKAQPEENKRQLFEQEAAFALELGKHPNIVYTHTVGRKENEYYIVMELVASKSGQENDRPHGNTLKDEFNRRAEGIDPETGFKWAIAFCEGMAYLNGKGMTAHKDIKPENIFITPDGTLKIGDFGLAGLSAKKAIGTRGYRAPEVKDGNFSVRSDIYAFGVVLYQLFNKGYNPTEPTYYTNAGTRMDDQNAQFPPPEEIRSRYAERIIRKCMALNPAERYGSFKDLQADLIQELKKIVPDYDYHAPEEGIMSAEDCFQKALGWGNLKKYDKAIRWNTQTIALAPKHIKSYYYCGLYYILHKNYKRGVRFFRKATKLEKNSSCYIYEWEYRNLRKIAQLFLNIEDKIKKNPTNAEPYYDRGDIFQIWEYHQQAIVDFSKVINLNPKYQKAYYKRAFSYFCLHKYYKTIEDCNKAIKRHRNCYHLRGQAYYAIKEYKKAIYNFTKNIEILLLDNNTGLRGFNNFNISRSLILRAWAYSRLQDYPKAIEDYTKAIELDPQFVKAYNNLIALYNRLNKPEEAKKWEALKKKNCPASDQ